MKIKVDRALCAGHAMCAVKGGDMFALDDDGFSTADGTVVPAGQEERARLGAQACPERAIELVDEASGAVLDHFR